MINNKFFEWYEGETDLTFIANGSKLIIWNGYFETIYPSIIKKSKKIKIISFETKRTLLLNSLRGFFLVKSILHSNLKYFPDNTHIIYQSTDSSK